MNAKQRVHAALRRQPVDRIPVFMWFHPQTARHLAGLLEIPAAYVAEAMGNDVRQTWVNNNYAMEGIVHEQDGEWHVDDWGIQWVYRHGFNQIAHFPLAGAPRDEVLRYHFPVERQQALLDLMAPVLADGGRLFHRLRRLAVRVRDVLAAAGHGAMRCSIWPADPDLAARRCSGRCADFSVQLSEPACDRIPLDWLWAGDDVAAQQGMMMSPRAWRELIKPELARIFAVGKQRGLPVAYHCCGALRPIIPDLIEIGLDVLNPVQCNCPGMDPLELKREFGDRLAFMGGRGHAGRAAPRHGRRGAARHRGG